MVISDWSSDVCSSDLVGSDSGALRRVEWVEQVGNVHAVIVAGALCPHSRNLGRRCATNARMSMQFTAARQSGPSRARLVGTAGAAVLVALSAHASVDYRVSIATAAGELPVAACADRHYAQLQLRAENAAKDFLYRKSVVAEKRVSVRVDYGGCRFIKKKKE